MSPHYFVAVLDACVFAPMPVADTLLRLAERDPAFYSPRWSGQILGETRRTLLKFSYSTAQAERRIDAVQEAFPEAMVTGYEDLVDAMKNDKKDRHVLAVAVRTKADCIVSDNVKHFSPSILEPLGLECLTAEQFFVEQYNLDPDAFIAVLSEQAKGTKRSLAELLAVLARHAPKVAELIRA
jgi:predicted nucleic acid-binding protein